jgi:hypothetical protein
MRTPSRLAAVVPLVFAATLVACGSSTPTSTASSTGAPSTAIPTTAPTAAVPTATPTAALTSLACPTTGTISSDLGLTVAAPMSQPAEDLPAGSSGIVCTYTDGAATPQVVVIDLATGAITTSFVSLVESGEQKAAQAQGDTFTATDTSGVGSQAAIVTVSAAGSPTENGIVAVSGNTGLVITVLPPLSQSQLESFASQLLG